MDNELGSRVARRRKELGMSQAELGRRVGVKQQTIASLETGGVRRGTRLHEIATALHVNIEWLRGESGAAAMPPRRDGAEHPPSSLTLVANGPDFPILGVVPRADGFVLGSIDAPEDKLARPAALAGAARAFAFYIPDAAMTPRYWQGDMVVVHPSRPPRAGDIVLVTLRADTDPAEELSMIRLLVSAPEADPLILQRYTPAGQSSIARARVLAIRRVLTLAEVLGG
jgi:transcriptional regulator with XRE-family HTH domain